MYDTSRRGPAIRKAPADVANETGRGSLSLPRWHPFVPLVGGTYDRDGMAVFTTQQQRREFIARWNDSAWAEKHGRLSWNTTDTE